jgi:tetratricopeptide (TPR) repeat protein
MFSIDDCSLLSWCSYILVLFTLPFGKVDSARELFRRAVRSNAKHAHAWQAWGVFEAKQSNLKAARTLFEAGLRECPDHCALWQVCEILAKKEHEPDVFVCAVQ